MTGGGLGAEDMEGGDILLFFLPEEAGLLLLEADAGDLFEDGERTGEDFEGDEEEEAKVPILPVSRGF